MTIYTKRQDLSREIITFDANINYPASLDKTIRTHNATLKRYRHFMRTASALPGNAPYPNPDNDTERLYYEPIGEFGNTPDIGGGHEIYVGEQAFPQRNKLVFNGEQFDGDDNEALDATIINLLTGSIDGPPTLPTSIPTFLLADSESVTRDGNGFINEVANKAITDRDLVQTNQASKPSWVENAAGSLPVIRFNKTHELHVSEPQGISEYTMYWVLRFNGSPANDLHSLAYEIGGNNSHTYARINYEHFYGGNFYNSQVPVLQNKYHILTFRITGSGKSMRLNDAEGPVQGVVTRTPNGGGNLVQMSIGQQANMDLAFVMGVHGVPTDSQDKTIMDYLKYHYAEALGLAGGEGGTTTPGTGGTTTLSGVRFRLAPGSPILGTPTVTHQPFIERYSEVLNNTIVIAVAQQQMSIPFAASGKKRRDVIVVNYLATPASYEVIKGAEVDLTFAASEPPIPADKLFVHGWDIGDGAAYVDYEYIHPYDYLVSLPGSDDPMKDTLKKKIATDGTISFYWGGSEGTQDPENDNGIFDDSFDDTFE